MLLRAALPAAASRIQMASQKGLVSCLPFGISRALLVVRSVEHVSALLRSLPSQNATSDLYVGGSEITSVAYGTAISGGDWDGWKFTSVDGTLKFAKLA